MAGPGRAGGQGAIGAGQEGMEGARLELPVNARVPLAAGGDAANGTSKSGMDGA